MTTSVVGYDLVRPALPAGGMMTRAPRILYGQGTPDGDLEPWLYAEKGSIFLSTNQTAQCAWVKTAANGADADWGAVGTKTVESKVFNLDDGAGAKDYDIFYFPRAIEILTAQLIYIEATDASGAAEANIRLGSAADGAQYVASTAIAGSKAIGAVTSLTIVEGTVAAGSNVFVSNVGIATSEAGKYKVQLTYIEN